MQLFTASEHTIKIGFGQVQGCTNSAGVRCWALPGGKVTFDRARAEYIAKEISRLVKVSGFSAN